MNSIRFLSKVFTLALVSGASGQAHAVTDWTNFGSIVELNQQQVGGAGSGQVFVTINVSYNPSACSVRNGFYFDVSDERKKRMFAMLMAAQLASRNVRVFHNGICHQWGYAELDGVIVQ